MRKYLLTKSFTFFAALFLILLSGFKVSARTTYWENPESVTKTDTRFPKAVSPNNSSGRMTSYVLWEEVETTRKRLYLSARTTTDGIRWREWKRFSPAINYSGEVPDVYSVAMNDAGTVVAVALTGKNQLTSFVASNGSSFQSYQIQKVNESYVAPRVYATSSGFILFASLGKNESFNLVYSTSTDGINWSGFTKFQPSAELRNPFVPYLAKNSSGKLIVVFQAQLYQNNRLSYQLYSTISENGGHSWSPAKLITDQKSMEAGSRGEFFNYNNQRPFIINFKDNGQEKFFLTWERSWYASENASICFAELSPSGEIKGYSEQVTDLANASNPILFSFENQLNLIWFDNRSGTERIYTAARNGLIWEEETLSNSKYPSTFGYPVISLAGKQLNFVWQQQEEKNINSSRIAVLAPDHTAEPPVLIAKSFKEDKRYSADEATVQIKLSPDSSGIAGYSWIFTQFPDEEPPEEINGLPKDNLITGTATEDGTWYFKAKQYDYAGNWSSSSSIAFNRDTTPPNLPVIHDDFKDVYGFLESNTFSIEWDANPNDNDVAGFSYILEYIAPLPQELVSSKFHPLEISVSEASQKINSLFDKYRTQIQNVQNVPKFNQGMVKKSSYENKRNGLYVFSVAAIDECGNIGEKSSYPFVLNKYKPSTYISTVTTKYDELGKASVSVYGGGFNYEGNIDWIFIDKDGKAPYDAEFLLVNGNYKIDSDSKISSIKLPELKEGRYRIGLNHTDRGLYLSGPVLQVTSQGTIKIHSDYSYTESWKKDPNKYTIKFNVGRLLVAVLFLFAFIVMIAAFKGLTKTAREAVLVRKEVQALLTGDIMPNTKIQKRTYTKKGTSLKVKLASFTASLVASIVVLVSVPLGSIMINTQTQTLSSGLYERVTVLMDSLASGAKTYLPTNNILELSYLPDQAFALNEARSATITGLGINQQNTNLNYIWATNDSNMEQKLGVEQIQFGSTQYNSQEMDLICNQFVELDKEAVNSAGEIAKQISELNREGIQLALKTDSSSVARRDEIALVTTQLNSQLNSVLQNLSVKGSGSYPVYDINNIDRNNTNYLFYKPVLYRQGSEQAYVRGIVLVEISTLSLLKAVDSARNTILYASLFVALVAVVIGILGSLILADVIIRPIKKLADYVAMIRDTEDKEILLDNLIEIKAKDEIGILGENVNEMTKALAKAASASKNLTVGKDIQTKFLPLEQDENGVTLTTGSLKAKGADFFSYYRGADELSGDYFDYRRLDNEHYAIIKCDVSGHGVPAALIMVEVATLFLSYFTDWDMKNPKQGVNLAPVVGKMNDLLESRGFKGRFAAFTLCIMNSRTGEVWFCNAGDNIVQLYDGLERRKKVLTLQETPAAGMFSTELIDMKGGYQVNKVQLNPGDVLFLYTDGIDESKRNFRNKDYELIKCAEGQEGSEHGTHKNGETFEEMTPDRVTEIIESVNARRIYTLNKYHDPDDSLNKSYQFDFTNCTGTAEDQIMSLVCVEKVFRMYRPADLSVQPKVKVDKKIDDYLASHFVQYKDFASRKEPVPGDNNSVYYMGVSEDPQYDDLTLIAIKKE